MNFIRTNTTFEGVFLIESKIHGDTRGDFMELYHESKFREIGIDTVFVQDNISTSKKGTIRGLHSQVQKPQAKLIIPLSGKIYDVIVDIRRDSLTYGKADGFILERGKGLFVPKGFAHGFLALTDDVSVFYKCDDFYDVEDESGIIWNDEKLDIDWQSLIDEYGIDTIIISEKDKYLPGFSDRE